MLRGLALASASVLTRLALTQGATSRVMSAMRAACFTVSCAHTRANSQPSTFPAPGPRRSRARVPGTSMPKAKSQESTLTLHMCFTPSCATPHGWLAQRGHSQALDIDARCVACPQHDAPVGIGELAARQDQSLLGQLARVLHVRRQVRS